MNTDAYYKSNNHIFYTRSSDTNIRIKTVPGQNLIIEGTASLTGSALDNNKLLIGNGLNQATQVSLSGDITTSSTGLTTLSDTGVVAGAYTSPTLLNVDAKGRITSATNRTNLVLGGGSLSAPSLTFLDSTTGMYSNPNQLQFGILGLAKFNMNIANVQATVPYVTESGASEAPAYSFSNDTDTGMFSPGGNQLQFSTGSVVRFGMRASLANSALVYVNKNTASVGSAAQETFAVQINSGINGIGCHLVSTSGTAIVFYTSTNTTLAGSITCNTNSTAYTSVSDRRLKENITPMLDGITRIMNLKPCYYDWKDGSGSNEGFIADELEQVVPGAVVGTKDAIDENGNPVYQSIDTSFIVSSLVSAVQELKRDLEELKTRLI